MSHNHAGHVPFITAHTTALSTAGAGQTLAITGFGLSLATTVDIPAALGVETARSYTKASATSGTLTITMTVESFTAGTSTNRTIPISQGGVPCQGVGVTAGAITVVHGFLPTQIASLRAWYDAGDVSTITFDENDNNKVSRWDDKSGNGFHAIQNSGTLQPAYVPSGGTIGQAHISFGWNSSHNSLQPASQVDFATQPNSVVNSSVFAVFHSDGAGGSTTSGVLSMRASPVFRCAVSSAGYTGASGLYIYRGAAKCTGGTATASLPTKVLGAWLLTDSGYVTRVNGAVDDTDSSTTGTGTMTEDMIIGHAWISWQWSDFELSELLVFNTEITGTDLTALESYLNNKWSIWT